MRILHVVTLGYEHGGAETGIVEGDKILRCHGHEVRVISSNHRADIPHFSDYEFLTIPTTGIRRFIYPAFNYSAYKLMRKVLSDFKPDVVLLHTMDQPTAAILFLLKKYPTILFVHGPEFFTKSLLRWHLPKQDYRNGSYELNDLTFTGKFHYYYYRYICGIFYKLGLRHVDRVVALSGYTQTFLREEGIKASYLPNGVRLRKFYPRPIKSPVLLSAGRLESYKGTDDLVRAMPRILQAAPDTVLNIAGNGDFGNELKSLTKKLGLEKSVKFLGHLNQEQLDKAYQRCTILIMPSVWPETFGKVGVEAMSVGRPVIATDVGGVRDWLHDGENGFIVEPRQPDQIADKVINLLADKAKIIRMSQAARATAEEFSTERMVQNIEKLMESVATLENAGK